MNAQRRLKFPPPPRPAKPPVEKWIFEFQAFGPADIPPMVRVRRMLKMALRTYRLRARIVAAPPIVVTPAPASTCVSTDAPDGPVQAANEAGGEQSHG